MKTQSLTLSEFAERVGASLPAVKSAARRGARLHALVTVGPDGVRRINFEAGRRAWRSRDPSRVLRARPSPPSEVEALTAAVRDELVALGYAPDVTAAARMMAASETPDGMPAELEAADEQAVFARLDGKCNTMRFILHARRSTESP